MRIAVIVGTTREGRVTPRLAHWVKRAGGRDQSAEFVMLDLKDFDIPMLEVAPWHEDRRLNDGTKRWLNELSRADGIIVVTAEYNHTIPAVLKNAFDYTQGELIRKPVAIVSHGVNNGVRANEHLRQIINSNIGAFPISATVAYVGTVSEMIDENGEPTRENLQNESKLQKLISEIVWYAKAIKQAKENHETN